MSTRPKDAAAPPSARRALADGWRLARPFWSARGERRAWALLAAVIALTLAMVWLNVQFNNWNNRFYDALQNHDLAAFWRNVAVFCALAAAFIVSAVYQQYLQGLLVIRWRTWLTDHLLHGWLRPGTAYRLGMCSGDAPDNPDQRVAEDARAFVTLCLDLMLGLLNAGVTLASFIAILWRLSGSLLLPIGAGLRISGYMVWVALGYSLAGTWIAQWLGFPLVGLNWQQQKVEADFRYTLVQVRDHAEAIALARGEAVEGLRLRSRFEAIRANWLALIRAMKRLTWFSAGYGQVANVFPVLAAASRYFSGAMMLGGLMQTAQAFGQVQGALSWLIGAYPQFANWRATVNRLSGFTAALEHDRAGQATRGIAHAAAAGDALDLSALAVQADGRDIVTVPRRRLEAGDRLLIAGPSGSGKSSLIRAIAGVWRDGRGRVELPAAATLMFVPQRPYLPEGTLREALAYPRRPEEFAAATMTQAMMAAGLTRYADELDVRARWSHILSPGEQQRLHFARVLLHRPDWVFLDEATSALDEAAEESLYRQLQSACPAMTIISVGHRSTLKRLHDDVWTIGVANAPSRVAAPRPATTEFANGVTDRHPAAPPAR